MRALQFDTRDTKPRLRALLALTGAAAAAAALIAVFKGDGGAAAICVVMAVYALGMILALLWAFREQVRYNPYSYNTIWRTIYGDGVTYTGAADKAA